MGLVIMGIQNPTVGLITASFVEIMRAKQPIDDGIFLGIGPLSVSQL